MKTEIMCIGSCYKFTRMAHLNTLPYCDWLITLAATTRASSTAASTATSSINQMTVRFDGGFDGG